MSTTPTMQVLCPACEDVGREHWVTGCANCGFPPALNGECYCGLLVVPLFDGERGPEAEYSRRFRRVSNRYPRRVSDAYGGDHVRPMADDDEQVAARVAAWEIAQGLEPLDWHAIGAAERAESASA